MSRQRNWANRAFERVLERRDGPQLRLEPEQLKKYRTLCMKTPSLIHQSGLAQAIVFLRSRDGEVGQGFVDDLSHALAAADIRDGKTLHQKALQLTDLQQYMVLTNDVSDVAAWYRRFAQIELKNAED